MERMIASRGHQLGDPAHHPVEDNRRCSTLIYQSSLRFSIDYLPALRKGPHSQWLTHTDRNCPLFEVEGQWPSITAPEAMAAWLTLGDALHAVLCGAGHNIRLILDHLRALFAEILAAPVRILVLIYARTPEQNARMAALA
ncbi:hypothetical protein DR046_22275 [Jannaschia formosa]|nr:hypothetical protein DR046_22275 [Jannaschia formosa]